MIDVINRIIDWGEKHDLLGPERIHAQMTKVMEETGELAAAVCRLHKEGQLDKAADAIGDSVVTLVLAAQQLGLDFENCVERAVEIIEARDGENVNGVFVKKDEDNA